MGTIVALLAGAVVLWWFVKPGAKGINLVAGIWNNVIAFFTFLTQGTI